MFERVALVHYHEIGLKGRNRSVFERRLRDNLDAALVGLPARPAERIASRLAVEVTQSSALDDVVARLAQIPGIVSVSPAYRTGRDLGEMERAALLALQEVPDARTFRVQARRSNTDFELNSMAMNVRLGDHLRLATGLTVNLNRPDATVYVEVVQGAVYVYARRLKGAGGLPVGTAGRVVSLLSAGIDSPVASWRLIRRGAVLVGVHFSGRPQTNDASERLVVQIGDVLQRTGGLGRIYLVPFGDLQREISLLTPPDLRVLLYRRLMIRVAEQIAAVENAKALVTGESLGQVASQTLDNILAVDEAASLPVLRPLVGSDKVEIIAEARRIGTYELSTQEHVDCCTLFMPRRPETHARLEPVLAAEEVLDTARMVDDALAGMAWQDYVSPSYRPPKRWRVTFEPTAATSSDAS
jgi:thiamine biosynthesis protein ThiI